MRKDNTMAKEITIEEKLDILNTKIGMMADIQMTIVNHLGETNDKFKMEFLMGTLANDTIRDDFTKFINQFETDDNIKLQMTAINELFLSAKEEE